MQAENLETLVLNALEELKAQDIKKLDVSNMTSITDTMVIASGRSSRHVKAISDAVIEKAKQNSFPVLGVEGQQTAEWILVDLGDLVLHVMQQETRDFYALEKLWSVDRFDQFSQS